MPKLALPVNGVAGMSVQRIVTKGSQVGKRIGREGTGNEAGAGKSGRAPVSYTHLTLPTIYSV